MMDEFTVKITQHADDAEIPEAHIGVLVHGPSERSPDTGKYAAFIAKPDEIGETEIDCVAYSMSAFEIDWPDLHNPPADFKERMATGKARRVALEAEYRPIIESKVQEALTRYAA